MTRPTREATRPSTRPDVSSVAEHRAAAAANANVALKLGGIPASNDANAWVPTILFYAGVQLVQATLAPLGCGGDHGGRLVALRGPGLGQAAEYYKQLQTISSDWRYKALRPSDADLQDAWAYATELARAIGEVWPGPLPPPQPVPGPAGTEPQETGI
jgi:hypothetical protein